MNSVMRHMDAVKRGPTAAADQVKRKNVNGQTKKPFTEGERTPVKDARDTTERTLVKEGEKHAGSCEYSHDFVKIVAEMMEKTNFLDFGIFQDDRHKFHDQHAQINGEAECHFGQHRVNIGMPENKPSPQRLPDVEAEYQQGRCVADNAENNGKIDNVFDVFNRR
jgi:hypothetical protein